MRGIKHLKNSEKKLSSSILFMVNIFLVLIIINLLSNNFGAFNKSFTYYFSIFLFYSLIFVNLPIKNVLQHIKKRKNILSTNLFFALLLFGTSVIVLIRSNVQVLWIAAISLFLSGLNLILKEFKIDRKELHLLSISSLVYAVFYILLQYPL